MGCWLRNGCVSVAIWLLGVFVLRRPAVTGTPAAAMVGFDSAFDCVRWGFRKWARGSNPEASSWEVSRDGTGTGGGATNGGLDWTTWGWGCGCGCGCGCEWCCDCGCGCCCGCNCGWGGTGTGTTPLLRDWWCGRLMSLLVEIFFCCLGTSPGGMKIYEIRRKSMENLITWGAI